MRDIQLIIYDFDGVMTNNKVIIDQDGKEMVEVSRADGLGVDEIKKFGIQQMILSTEKNLIVSARAKKLGIPCLQGIDDKQKALMHFCEKNKLDLRNVAYVGNDINDKEAMKISGITFCPSDAHKKIKLVTDYVLKTKGGYGVVRELMEILIKQKEK